MNQGKTIKKRITQAILLLCIIVFCVFTSCKDPTTLIYTVTYDGNGHTEGTVPESTSAAEIIMYARWISKNATSPDSFTCTEFDGEITITGYTGADIDLVIPDIIDDRPVTSIGTAAFANLTDLTAVTLPESVVEIGNDAFANCSGLTSLTIPASVTSIGSSACSICRSLISVTVNAILPPGLGGDVFNGCTALSKIYVPVDTVGAYQTAWSAYSNYIAEQP